MILSDTEILARGVDLIEPFDSTKVQPASYDLALATGILVPASHVLIPELAGDPVMLDLRVDSPADYLESRVIPESGFELAPGASILASTLETVTCPKDCAARVEGKSSLGRIFLAVHITAGFIDPGFSGQVTLEIVNLGRWSIMLWPCMPIAQVSYERLSGVCATPYGSQGLGSHYQGQMGVTPAAGRRNLESK